jgi:uncharacterized protein RhaS with RHS repeats
VALEGSHQNYFRDYDPAVGRYVESDPTGLRAGVNTYAYVRGNPVFRFDRKGLVDGWTDPFGPPDFIPPPPIQIMRGIPRNACSCHTSSGSPFLAPPDANFTKVVAAGQAGGLNPFSMNAAVGHFGAYDFQRNYLNNEFTGAYTDASNYAVGVYLQGAGYSLEQALAIAQFFAQSMSSNAGDPRQQGFWLEGWNDANLGRLPGACQ